jgi:hypothetical protein
MTTRSTCAAALIALLAACEEHTTEPDHAVEACEHLKGTATMINGSTTPAPEISSHMRFEVSLLDTGIGGKTGTVRFQVPRAGHVLVFLTADIPVKLTNPNGGELTAAKINKTGPCSELKAWYEYEAAVGPHSIALGGTTTSVNSVGVVVETEAHAH